MNDSLKQKVLSLISGHSTVTIKDDNFSFAGALEYFVDYSFTESEAETHWNNVLNRLSEIEQKFARRISLYTAIVDYFTSDEHFFNSPVLVEIKVLRKAEELAMIDGLTGTFNRRYMDLCLRKEINRCNRYKKLFSVMLLDIDDFKKLNDNYGHIAGDEALHKSAKILKETIREEDVLCRYGGEEFLIIMPETCAEKALKLFSRIQEKLLSSDVHKSYNLTFSAGCATYSTDAENLIDLLRCADISLYKAKKNGKNQIVEYGAI
mgnify:CR=1 FL=1